MGNATYSTTSRSFRAKSLGYTTNDISQNFTQRKVKSEMDPNGVSVREARDSDANPQSFPIILGLDVTGSMGMIPQHLVVEGLPKIMGRLIQQGMIDPALLFIAVGDHECDRSPLQVGQFESGDEELDNWLTSTYLEGGGGGNNGESYLLAWYFAAFHTETDSVEKRGQKGLLVTIGDEPNLTNLSQSAIKDIMGDTATGQQGFSAKELLEKASEKYEVFHINVEEGHAGQRSHTHESWKELLGQNFISVSHRTDIPQTIVDLAIRVSPAEEENIKAESPTTEETEPEIIM